MRTERSMCFPGGLACCNLGSHLPQVSVSGFSVDSSFARRAQWCLSTSPQCHRFYSFHPRLTKPVLIGANVAVYVRPASGALTRLLSRLLSRNDVTVAVKLRCDATTTTTATATLP